MANRREWPVQVSTTGAVIAEMDQLLQTPERSIPREQLQRWQDCVIYCAALLDRDNQPSTPEQLARMRLRR